MGELKANIALFSVGVLFLISAINGAVMSPELFGAAVYIIPAEAWAISMMAAAAVVIAGLALNGWANPVLRILGNSIMLTVFGAFAYLSNQAVFGSMLVAFSAVYFVPQCLSFIYGAARDLWKVDWK